MSRSNLLRAAGVLGIAALALAAMSSAVPSGPQASFEVRSGTPSAGAPVQFAESSSGRPSGWQWTFGDGSGSGLRNPAHVFAAAGIYPVTLKVTDASGDETQTTRILEVLPPTMLRLMARTGRSFDVTLVVRDPESGETVPGQAAPQGDAFGYFAIPDRTTAVPETPLTPEVFVKMQDVRAQDGDFWVFWGGPTELPYTLTVRDNVTGVTKVMRSPAPGSPAGLGIDKSGFLAAAAERVVNVGQNGSNFVDSQSGTSTTSIHVGDTVKWNWVDGPHSSTSGKCKVGGGGGYYGYAQANCTPDGAWDSTSHSAPYEYSRTFETPGTYTYFCGVHGEAMTGTVVVSAQALDTTATPVPGTNAEREPVERVQDLQRGTRLVGRPSPNTGMFATATPTVPGQSPTATPTPTPPAGATRVVEIRSNFFRDRVSQNSTTTIDVGTKVEWEWESGFHSTTSGPCPPCNPDGKWNSPTQSSGTFDHTFVEADRGQTFPYYCVVHGSIMTGRVVVNP